MKKFDADTLQWRAGQLPGRTQKVWQSLGLGIELQWRAGQLPGRTCVDCSTATWDPGFNGGPGNCPAGPCATSRVAPSMPRLQWRAGQLPGRTSPLRCWASTRPRLQWRAGQLPGRTRDPRMDRQGELGASMEGRAIARPDPSAASGNRRRSGCFNGGPGNCPAGPGPARAPSACVSLHARKARSLQWRAGQLPGRTTADDARSDGIGDASMEGRAIARPDRRANDRHCADGRRFNGGPGNCPAGRGHAPRTRLRSASLQWRAGQLPGRTPTLEPADKLAHAASMEGRAIARPDRGVGLARARQAGASMEGRAIARPDMPGESP